MEEQNHIDKALAFLESLEKLGNQLKVAEENQKQFLARMLELKKSGETDSEEYADLSRKSKRITGHHRQMASYLFGANGNGEKRTDEEA